MSARHGRGTRRAVCIAALASACAAATGADFRADFADTRNPPPYRALGAAERARFDLGHALLNTQWVAAGTPNAARRDGLGPVFNAASCDACHNEGARGQGLAHDGALPASIVVQLARTTPDGGDAPDPAYGHVLNPEALDGFAAEADVEVRYAVREGRYADGTPWQLREPHYEIRGLRYGALAADTAIKPRI
ncbi:MAG TPA: di-heme oxidoredictase family protein, partial [Dokdonella sp.]